MSIRRILVPLAGGQNDKLSFAAAFMLANSEKAHIDACLIKPDPEASVPYLRFADSSTEDIKEDFRVHAERTGKQAAARARRQFNRAGDKLDIARTADPNEVGNATAYYKAYVGRVSFEIPRLAKICDIPVFGGTTLDVLRPSNMPVFMMH